MIRHLQSALAAAFLRADGVFNAAFGERLNPLYHLGAITFMLFWVVGASGLYLYAFFETGVAAAHASVESLTHDQWFAGGVLRSMHRYASDAMVVTMLVHLLRHFAFDRFRGLRAFSWLTGVVLVGLVFVSGINGYMLPWDPLAQFVVITSFEWLDALPGFGGTLMRNFVYASSVTDRFFSLLSFMHVGLPLAVLLLMWVHVQRVPKARTLPPAPITAGLGGSLFVLCIVMPAVSQGGAAHLGHAVATVRLDWFYLSLLPLADTLPLRLAWGVAAVAGLAIALLPYAPRPRAGRGEHQATVEFADGRSVRLRVRDAETLLDAGLREGLALPYQCRQGGCGVCVCSVRSGSVRHHGFQPAALPAQRQAQGMALMCCAVPLEDVGIAVDAAAAPARRYAARVTEMERLAPDVMRLRLQLPPGERIAFRAGQYVQVLLEDGQRRAFSFANPPQQDGIELHVRRIPGGRFTGHVFEQLRAGDTLRFEGPFGDFALREGARPIVFVAGATGFAPVKSLLEDAFARGVQRPMALYWGVRRPHDLYLAPLAQQWAREHPNFRFVPVVSEVQPEDRWTGRCGLVHEALVADQPDLGARELYVCGSVAMVDTALPVFLSHGLGAEACFSDAFVPNAAMAAASGGSPPAGGAD